VRMGVRDYDPEINRFTTPDPLYLELPELCLKSPVECNLYSYALNDPAHYLDPSGRSVVPVVDAAFIAYDLWSLGRNYLKGDRAAMAVDAAALGMDLMFAFLPGPPGAGLAVRAGAHATAEVAVHAGERQLAEVMVQAGERAAAQGIAKALQLGNMMKNGSEGTSAAEPARATGTAARNGGRSVTNSAGDEVFRTLVQNEDQLLAAAERRAGGSLDKWKEYKPGWWQSPDGKMRIELNLEGHANTKEGPHVTVRQFNGTRHAVIEKIFIEGREKYR
jgi:RHS repeat-associated protein